MARDGGQPWITSYPAISQLSRSMSCPTHPLSVCTMNWTSTKRCSLRHCHLKLWSVLLVLVSLLCSCHCLAGDEGEVYLNKWAVHIVGGPAIADDIATTHGFHNLGQIGSLEEYYLFEHHNVVKRSTGPSHHHHVQLDTHPMVSWVEQQTVKRRVKRDLTLDHKPDNTWNPEFIDPQWAKMWYLHGGATGRYDMRVKEAWERGYTGKGVVVTILDDGIEHTHSDLAENYDPDASKDINDNDKDPMPRYNSMDENRHGTRCAGEVSAVANNSACAVGIAYHSSIGGVRMLDGDVSDFIEAKALSLNPQHIDIYSASWGPDDNGIVVDGPAKLAREAFLYGILKGRNGKGSIYVWASGNGGANSDSCSCDGYTNSIFTLSVSSASEHGKKPWYLEECSSTLATTYSSGDNYGERKIVTTDLRDRCTESHTGTSASAPLAAAMCALALEANPDLTWRDMQYITILSARTEPLYDGEWVINGVGRKVSHKYGYGLLDGERMVELAERWSRVPPQHICQSKVIREERPLEGKQVLVTSINMDACRGTEQAINYLEHVQAKVTLTYNRRGNLQIHLTSPNGTKTTILPERKKDVKRGDFKDWPFMSVFFWGEQPQGEWILEIENTGASYNSGTLYSWQLIMYGTETEPIDLLKEARPRPTNPPPEKVVQTDKENIETTESDLYDSQSEAYDEEPGYIEYVTDNKGYDIYGEAGPHSAEPDYDLQLPEIACDIECDPVGSCWGSGPDACELCRNVRFGVAGPCVSVCPETTYLSYDIATCLLCPETCSSCVGPDPDSDCTSCIPSLLLLSPEGACVGECPAGMYTDATNSCQPCDVTCKQCDLDPSRCLVCTGGHDLVEFTCIPTCTDNQFRDNTGGCLTCDESCVTCSGPGSTNCLRCHDDSLYYSGTCVTECLPGFYHEQTELGEECRSCHPSCAACDGEGADRCISCTLPMKLVGSQCMEDCPYGQFEVLSGECENCHESCVTCKGREAKHCLSCATASFLEFGHCVLECQEGYYDYISLDTEELGSGIATGTRECRQCDRSCRTCDGGSPENCTTCKEGLLWSRGRCVAHCAAQEYIQDGQRCELCSPGCATCAGPGSENCTSCLPELYLWHTQCIPECPQGHYLEEQQCHLCHVTCLSCYGSASNMCLSCEEGLMLTDKGHCVRPVTPPELSECGQHHYYQPLDGACHPCDDSCDTCDGPGQNRCLSCEGLSGYYSPRRQCVPCCSHAVQSECCSCSLDAGVCTDYHHHFVPQPPPPLPSPGVLVTSPPLPYTTTSRSHPPSHAHSTPHHPSSLFTITPSSPMETDVTEGARSRASTLWPGFVTTMVCLSIFVILLFLFVFGLLQAKSNEKLCWRSRYTPVPTIYQNGHTQKVHFHNGTRHPPLSHEDFADEDETTPVNYNKVKL